jgi:hypothetical protein
MGLERRLRAGSRVVSLLAANPEADVSHAGDPQNAERCWQPAGIPEGYDQ